MTKKNLKLEIKFIFGKSHFEERLRETLRGERLWENNSLIRCFYAIAPARAIIFFAPADLSASVAS
jgi:hypothetical protein